MKENNKNEESGDSGTLRMLAQPPDIPTLPGYTKLAKPVESKLSLSQVSPYILRDGLSIIIILLLW